MSEEVFYDCMTELKIDESIKTNHIGVELPKNSSENNIGLEELEKEKNSKPVELKTNSETEPEKLVEKIINETLEETVNETESTDEWTEKQNNNSNTEDESIKDIPQNDNEPVEVEENLSDDEKLERQSKASALKREGNDQFRSQEYEEAKLLYSEAITICPKCYEKDLSVLYSNRSVCWMKLDNKEKALEDCTASVELNEDYIKPLLRRAQLYEALEKLDESLEDYKKLVEKDPSMTECHIACRRLNEKINERNERLKTEMMGKLKDLGNLVLRPFGLSTNNFQMEQNTETGSYNIQFVNNNADTTGGQT